MSNFFKNKNNGLSAQQNKKEQKKAINKALHQVFAMAREGQVASLNHEGVVYLMLRNDKFTELIQNGGRLNSTPQQQEFNRSYQQLLQFLGTLDVTNERQNEAFNELDALTFDFSEARMKKEQEKVVEDYKAVLEKFPELTEPTKQAGKLT
jgi:outer membrane protein OmpA-like peptidoglycan-associated protein